MRPRPEEVIDLDRYPVHDATSPLHRELLDHCRAKLSADCCCRVRGFFRAEAIETPAAMALRLEDKVHRRPALADPHGGDLEGGQDARAASGRHASEPWRVR